jgi:hypothetical protein
VEWQLVANEFDRIAWTPLIGQILRDFAELAARWCGERSRDPSVARRS